tara:strand:- start:6568 stop:7206 length:639 start_codon:yes stop_codon:yes gene_type:complete
MPPTTNQQILQTLQEIREDRQSNTDCCARTTASLALVVAVAGVSGLALLDSLQLNKLNDVNNLLSNVNGTLTNLPSALPNVSVDIPQINTTDLLQQLVPALRDSLLPQLTTFNQTELTQSITSTIQSSLGNVTNLVNLLKTTALPLTLPSGSGSGSGSDQSSILKNHSITSNEISALTQEEKIELLLQSMIIIALHILQNKDSLDTNTACTT